VVGVLAEHRRRVDRDHDLGLEPPDLADELAAELRLGGQLERAVPERRDLGERPAVESVLSSDHDDEIDTDSPPRQLRHGPGAVARNIGGGGRDQQDAAQPAVGDALIERFVALPRDGSFKPISHRRSAPID
jgi:hypothetical protein